MFTFPEGLTEARFPINTFSLNKSSRLNAISARKAACITLDKEMKKMWTRKWEL